MARARTIKPAFFKSVQLAECEPFARILFAGLWCLADREGRLEDRPRRLKAEILPYDNCDAEALLEQLVAHKLIVRYQVDGVGYISIPRFTSHQRPHPKEPPSVCPCPETGEMVPPRPKYIYFIQAGDHGHIKIGTADDPHGRLSELQTANALPLTLLGVVAAGEWSEMILHKLFHGSRKAGEWFDESASILEFVKTNCIQLTDKQLPESRVRLGAGEDPYSHKPRNSTAQPNQNPAGCALPSLNPSLSSSSSPAPEREKEVTLNRSQKPDEFSQAMRRIK
jgi:hypothetical protein